MPDFIQLFRLIRSHNQYTSLLRGKPSITLKRTDNEIPGFLSNAFESKDVSQSRYLREGLNNENREH
ncbi:hypothetical protein BOTCAL_0029g00350 [Botryotinia calthae]|uniref:Uncharacterized protein n=1 Tax=Botryotinia calthae TaxID=38488 RepID=A0A4Y8DG75_9HELO|nr:hypothetical protein BOTCAL_0029g00350 [Botryotinia calthae]